MSPLRANYPIEVGATMGKDLRNVFNVPLRSRDLAPTVNLLDGRFDCTGANGAKLFCLKITVIDNAMSMESVNTGRNSLPACSESLQTGQAFHRLEQTKVASRI